MVKTSTRYTKYLTTKTNLWYPKNECTADNSVGKTNQHEES